MRSKDGQHSFVCRKNNGRIWRHSALNVVIQAELKKCNIPSLLEPSHLMPNCTLRPDGATMVPWERGKCLVWDFSCSHPTAASYIDLSSKKMNAVCNKNEEKKMEKYHCFTKNFVVQPICFDSYGGMGDATICFIKKIQQLQKQKENNMISHQQYIWQRLSVALQKANAKLILNPLY